MGAWRGACGAALVGLLWLCSAGRGDLPAPAATEAARPGVAVLLPPDAAGLQAAVDWEWTLQEKVKLVDPGRIAATVQEHPFLLNGKTTAADLVALAKYVDADYLLAVMPGENGTTVRLVDVNAGKMVVDGTVSPATDPYLVAAGARERVMAALDPAAHKAAVDAKQEMAYWRALARSLMPRSDTAGCRAPFDVLTETQRGNCRQAIRAWEGVLALDEKDNEALLNLGVSLVSLVRFDLLNGGAGRPETSEKKLAIPLALRGTKLVEAALLADGSAYNAATFQQAAGALTFAGPKCVPVMERMAEMDQFLLDHPKMFKDFEVNNAHLRMAQNPMRLPKEIEAAVHPDGAGKLGDPYMIGSLFMTLANSFPDAAGAGARLEIAQAYVKDADPVVQFFAEYVIAEALWRDRKDPAALEHYDRMLAMHEEVYAALKRSTNGMAQKGTVDGLYRYRFNACDVLGLKEEARETILQGAKHYMAAGRFNDSVAFVYWYAVIHVLHDDPKAALPIADAYIKAKEADRGMNSGDEGWLREVAEYRKVEMAKAAGEKVPDFSGMQLIAGTETAGLARPEMVASAGRIWLAWQPWQSGGPALVYRPGADRAMSVLGLPPTQRAVAAVGGRIYFGGLDGLFELNGEGAIVRRFVKGAEELPALQIVDLRQVGDALYFSWRDGDQYGVGRLEPAAGKITRLAPSKAGATLSTEPVYDAYRIWWDAAGDQVIVNNDGSPGISRLGWAWSQEKWTRPAQGFLAAISQGAETLTITRQGKEQVLRLKGSKEVRLSLLDVSKVPEPAWDKETIYLPTTDGLYGIVRATGEMKWLAHQENTTCLAVCVEGGEVYVATVKGLFRWAGK